VRAHRRSALCEGVTSRYGKEGRRTQDNESSEPDVDLKLVGFGLNSTKFGGILPKLAGIQSNSTTSDRFTGFRLLPIEVCRFMAIGQDPMGLALTWVEILIGYKRKIR
jgi:hypothetical protein